MKAKLISVFYRFWKSEWQGIHFSHDICPGVGVRTFQCNAVSYEHYVD